MTDNGGIKKGNSSSNDNTLAFPQFNVHSGQWMPNPPAQNKQETNLIVEYNQIMNNNFNSDSKASFNKKDVQIKDDSYPNANNDSFKSQNNNFNPNFHSATNRSGSFSNQNYPGSMSANNSSSNIDIRNSIDFFTKQHYKQELDKQMEEKYNKNAYEKEVRQNEAQIINNYPFGQRTDPTTYLNHNNTRLNSYQMGNHPNGHPIDYRQSRIPDHKFNKDNIVEKPNSLNNDMPSYDPIKHRNGNNNGYTYDPWGKPGGGAPMVDKDSGRKFTKISGQVWYDTIGVFPDERAKHFADKTRILPIEEQKRHMEQEQARKKYEIEEAKRPMNDVSTWITGFENQRKEHQNSNYGAHLTHTNVTRDKVDQEAARRYNSNAKSYHSDLDRQLEERNRQNKLSKLKEDVAGIEHTKKWNDLWGRPGAGAPNGTERRRRDVIGTLESPRVGDFNNNYGGKSLPLSDMRLTNSTDNLLYGKTIKHSNHTNLYDNEPPMKVIS